MFLKIRVPQQLLLSSTRCSFILLKGDSAVGVFLLLNTPSQEQETKQQQAIHSSLSPLPGSLYTLTLAVAPQKQHLWSPSSTVSPSS